MVFESPAAPPRIALTLPDRTSYVLPEVNVPPAPVIEPLTNCTLPTVSELPAMDSVPPLTTSELVSASVFVACPRFNVPVLTVVTPV